MDKTQHYSLQKPNSSEKYSIQVHNMNMDLIDSALMRIEQKNESQDNLLATKVELNSEITRATVKENEILQSLNTETLRAEEAENKLANNLTEEIDRAIITEQNISKNLSEHILDETNPHKVTKSQIELGNVDNTSDMDKPVSTSQQTAIDLAVTNHNTSTASHTDIRNLISELATRLNALADSDDTTLDQLSEIVAYIKNNKTLIDSITTSKVSVSDIIDNLTSTDIDKPLSANQGKVLKELISSLTKSDIGLGNVENKSSETIRSELTKEDVTTALGYTPQEGNTGVGITYSDTEPTLLTSEMTWIGK